MTDNTPTMNPNEIREWEMKIGRFEGFDTEITHYLKYCGRVVPQTKDIIPRYHQSLPDLMRVLKKFERSSITTIGEMVTCQISLEIPLSRADIHDTYESAIFHAIIRNIS